MNGKETGWAVSRVLVGAVLISFSAILVPLAGVSPALAAFYRVAIGGVALLVFAWLRGESMSLKPRFLFYVSVAGLAFAVDLVFWHMSIYRVGPGIATLLANFQVVLMALAGWLFWRERLHWGLVTGIFLALTGLLLIVITAPGGGHRSFLPGIGYGLIAALAYTSYLLVLRLAGGGETQHAPAFYIGLVSLATAIPLALWLLVENRSFVVPHLHSWLWLLLYGLGPQAAGWLLISTALPRIPMALAGLLLLLQPALTFEWAHLIFYRRFTAPELVGAGLALVGLYLGVRFRQARSKAT